MYVEISLSAYEGAETDDERQDSGEATHVLELDTFLKFEVVTPTFKRVHANGPFWARHREDILQAIRGVLFDIRVEGYKLPLDTELFKWHPRSKELKLDYIIRCNKCADGMSETTDSGLCSVCDA